MSSQLKLQLTGIGTMPPGSRVMGDTEMPSLAGTDIFTVTAQVAVLLEPSAALAVMVALPLATAVTKPFASTVATEVLLLLHVTLLLVAFSGVTVAVSCSV